MPRWKLIAMLIRCVQTCLIVLSVMKAEEQTIYILILTFLWLYLEKIKELFTLLLWCINCFTPQLSFLFFWGVTSFLFSSPRIYIFLQSLPKGAFSFNTASRLGQYWKYTFMPTIVMWTFLIFILPNVPLCPDTTRGRLEDVFLTLVPV